MEKDIASLLDAAAFQASDMIGPATVLEGAGRHLLDRLDLTDPHRWAVTSAIGSITAARKSLQDAAEELLAVVSQDGADMLAIEVSKGAIVEKPKQRCGNFSQPSEDGTVLLCRKDNGHLGVHCDGEGASWSVGLN